MIRLEFSVFEIAQVIPGAQSMANAQHHPFVAELKHVGAGDVFFPCHAQVFGEIRMKQFALEEPVLEVFRGGYCRILSATEGVIGVAYEPAVGIPVPHFGGFTVGGFRFDNHGLGPFA